MSFVSNSTRSSSLYGPELAPAAGKEHPLWEELEELKELKDSEVLSSVRAKFPSSVKSEKNAERKIEVIKKVDPEFERRHRLFNELANNLEKSGWRRDWKKIEEIYGQLSKKDQDGIKKLIRFRSYQLGEELQLDKVEEMISECIKSKDDTFAKKYFLPSIYQYLNEVFEKEEFESIYNLAVKAFQNTRKEIHISENHIFRNGKLVSYILSTLNYDLKSSNINKDDEILKKAFDLRSKIRDKHKTLREAGKIFYDPKKETVFFYSISDHQVTKLYGFGICGDMSNYAFAKLAKDKSGIIKNAQVHDVKNEDHAVVIVNKDDESEYFDEKDPTTWGKRCFLLDCWSDGVNIYPVYPVDA